jgi:hypothetical protein
MRISYPEIVDFHQGNTAPIGSVMVPTGDPYRICARAGAVITPKRLAISELPPRLKLNLLVPISDLPV